MAIIRKVDGYCVIATFTSRRCILNRMQKSSAIAFSTERCIQIRNEVPEIQTFTIYLFFNALVNCLAKAYTSVKCYLKYAFSVTKTAGR